MRHLKFAAASTALLALAGCGMFGGADNATIVTSPQAASNDEVPVVGDAVAFLPSPADTTDAPSFFTQFFSSRSAPAVVHAPNAAGDELTLAAAGVQDEITEDIPEEDVIVATIPARRGLFGFGSAAVNTGPDARQVAAGTAMPYGEIATVCGVSGSALGTKITEASGYAVYDTIPNSTALRPHYVTGFADDCARTFTGAMVMLGDIGTHEIVRYNPVNVQQAYSGTDTAYEVIKASYCRVPKGKPCGRKIDRFSDRTTFITVYQSFGSNPVWVEMLLADGKLAAIDFEQR